MQVEVTSQLQRTGRGYRQTKGRAYISTNALDPIDEWARETSIYSRRWKSKAWSLLGRAYSKLVREVISKTLKVKSTFSGKAGCSCGCSPGFVLEDKNGTWGHDYRFKIEFTDEELEPIRQACEKATKMFEKELEENGEK